MPIPQTTEKERERAVGRKSSHCMDPDASASGASSSAAAAADTDDPAQGPEEPTPQSPAPPPPPPSTSASASQQQQPPSRYESQKRRDWNTFLQYLKNHRPPLTLARCSGAHVIEFLKYLDQFGKTKVHAAACPYFGQPAPPAPCACPLRQAWGSLDALIGRLRAAFEENGGKPEANPFGARPVRIYLREVRESQAKARGIPYEKKKRKRLQTQTAGASSAAAASGGGGGESSTVERPASPAAAADPAVGGDGSGSGAKEGPSAPETSGGGSTS